MIVMQLMNKLTKCEESVTMNECKVDESELSNNEKIDNNEENAVSNNEQKQ